MDRSKNRYTKRINATNLVGWMLFCFYLWLHWHNINILRELPSFGDMLEVVWGLHWYDEVVQTRHLRLFYDGIFHPVGWYVGTLAHTITFFATMLPAYWIGGAAFSINVHVIVSHIVAFLGGRRFFGRFAATKTHIYAIVAAIAWTFVPFRAIRAQGHLNQLWMLALFPWFADTLTQMRDESTRRILSRTTLTAGLLWGVMINISLYSVFFGAIFWLLLGKRLREFRIWLRMAVSSTLALLIGSPALLMYLLVPKDGARLPTMSDLASFSAPINSLFLPSLFHPITPFHTIAHTIYNGLLDERGAINLGIIMALLAMVGMHCVLRKRRQHFTLILVAAVGLIMALGPYIKLDERHYQNTLLEPVNELFWQVGAQIKPTLFPEEAWDVMRYRLPLPYLPLVTVVPRLESARTVSRFALVAGLALFALATVGLGRLPRWLAIVLALLWLLEVVPPPAKGVAFDPDAMHPAYSWLLLQPLAAAEGIWDITHQTEYGGQFFWSSLQTGVPTAAGAGSFVPESFVMLDEALAVEGVSAAMVNTLQTNRIRYLFVHRRNLEAAARWQEISDSNLLESVGCFEPDKDISTAFQYPICVATVPRQ